MRTILSRLRRALTVLFTDEMADPSRTTPDSSADVPPPPATTGTVTVTGTHYGQSVGVNLGTIILQRPPSDAERRFLIWYLATLSAWLNQLPLRGLQTSLGDQGQGIALCGVYVMLATQGHAVLAQGRPADLEPYLDPTRLRQGEATMQAVTAAYRSDQALPDQAILQIEPLGGGAAFKCRLFWETERLCKAFSMRVIHLLR